MKITAAFLLIAVSFLLTPASGQETKTRNKSLIKLQDISLQSSLNYQQVHYPSAGEFREIAPGSQILKDTFDNYSHENEVWRTNSDLVTTFSLGYNFTNIQKNSLNAIPHLRAGIAYYHGLPYWNYYSGKIITLPYDTVTSSQTGTKQYIDTSYGEGYELKYRQDQIRLDAQLLLGTFAGTRWQLSAGIGVSSGVRLNSRIDIRHFKFGSTHTSIGQSIGFNPNFSRASEVRTEKFHNKVAFAASVYIPYRLDFRLSKKNNMLGRMQLYFEGKIGLDMATRPELRSSLRSFAQRGFGLRYSMHAS